MTALWLVGLSILFGPVEPLDRFDYPTAAAAQAAWTASERTPPLGVVRDADRTVLEVNAPFAANEKLGRSVIDRKVKLDLAEPGALLLEILVDEPKAVGGLTLYFHSGRGWYSASGGKLSAKWHTLRFSKAAFRTEEEPAGWNAVDGVRIALWRGQPLDTKVRIRLLASETRSVALVFPTGAGKKEQGELKAAFEFSDRVASMLEELGLGADALDSQSLSLESLGKRRVAIVAYHPRMEDATAATLEKFVDSGGKVILCYSLPERLGKALGFRRGQYVRPTERGQLAEMRFDAADIPGLPAAAKQISWNINTAEPDGHNARVIARWFTEAGQPTGHPAVLLSDRGAYVTHVLLPEDHEAKKQLLAALLGRLEPSLWPEMVQRALADVGRIGHLADLDELARFVAAQSSATAKEKLQAGLETRNKAQSQLAARAYPQAIDTARQARELLVDAYLRAQPSRDREGRAVWNHSATGAYPGDWMRSAKELHEAGFNMVVPNMLWGGLAHYASDVLPRSKTFDEHGDQIAQCVEAAHKHGLEVHVWKVNWNLSTAPKDFVAEMRKQGRTQVTVNGEPHDWLCPSHPQNFKLELDSLLEVARKYDVDGLHFDYIRYPDGSHCYCAGCRKRFEADSGKPVADWPKDCHSGLRSDEYHDWRCAQITRLVAAVRAEVRNIKPKMKLSAAVFGSYPDCRKSVGQDWPEWVRKGYLDFICPMDYTLHDEQFCNLVENQLRLVEGRIPMYPGIGATASRVTLSADRVAGQVHHARRLGAAGFTVFNFQESVAKHIIPGVGLGATARPAAVPHRP